MPRLMVSEFITISRTGFQFPSFSVASSETVLPNVLAHTCARQE